MLLSFGKQHGNEEARICDLSTPQQARSAVQFIVLKLKKKKRNSLLVNSVIFYTCNIMLPSMLCTALMDNPSYLLLSHSPKVGLKSTFFIINATIHNLLTKHAIYTSFLGYLIFYLISKQIVDQECHSWVPYFPH